MLNDVVNPEAAEAVVGGIREAGGEAVALEADVSDAGQVGAMFATVDQTWGGLDILVPSHPGAPRRLGDTFYWPDADRWEGADFSVKIP